MDVREVRVTQAELLHITEHGHCYVNPYYGCSEGCPFCYWNDLPGWAGNIQVRVNAPEILDEYLANRACGGRIYIGSYCNPYEDVEKTYRITRSMLQVLKRHHAGFTLMTSSQGVVQDLPLLAGLGEKCTIVFELSRIERMLAFQKTGRHPVLDAANLLFHQGITVWTTLSPYLHGITDLEAVLDVLDEGIPVYTGPLDVLPGTAMYNRFMDRIEKCAPWSLAYYQTLIRQGRIQREFEKTVRGFDGVARLKRFPLPEETG